MKRELKVYRRRCSRAASNYCKAHPDEKGTERIRQNIEVVEKLDCKAHPDEKGTERQIRPGAIQLPLYIARPIPMKRELKGVVAPFLLLAWIRIARPIPMKRELKADMKLEDRKVTEIIARPIPMKRELKDYAGKTLCSD